MVTFGRALVTFMISHQARNHSAVRRIVHQVVLVAATLGIACASANVVDAADTTAPIGSLSFTPSTYTKSTSVNLNLSASDSVGVTGYRTSTDSTPPAASGGGWSKVKSSASFVKVVNYTLTSGDGTKTVYAWYKDAAGNVSPTASASITPRPDAAHQRHPQRYPGQRPGRPQLVRLLR